MWPVLFLVRIWCAFGELGRPVGSLPCTFRLVHPTNDSVLEAGDQVLINTAIEAGTRPGGACKGADLLDDAEQLITAAAHAKATITYTDQHGHRAISTLALGEMRKLEQRQQLGVVNLTSGFHRISIRIEYTIAGGETVELCQQAEGTARFRVGWDLFADESKFNSPHWQLRKLYAVRLLNEVVAAKMRDNSAILQHGELFVDVGCGPSMVLADTLSLPPGLTTRGLTYVGLDTHKWPHATTKEFDFNTPEKYSSVQALLTKNQVCANLEEKRRSESRSHSCTPGCTGQTFTDHTALHRTQRYLISQIHDFYTGVCHGLARYFGVC
jgi:hypothetical protein